MSNSKTGLKSPKSTSISKSRKSNPTYITERNDILNGEVIVLRTKQSKDAWQFRMRVRGEGAYYRESLCTKHLGMAIARAKNKWADITAMVNAGKKVFSITVAEMVQIYLDHRQRHAELGLLSAESMMRFGELCQLQWRSVSDYFTRIDGFGARHSLVKITVLADTSKVRKTRYVIVKAGTLFDEIRSDTEHSSGDGYLFGVEAGRMLTRRQMYSCWRELTLLMELPKIKRTI